MKSEDPLQFLYNELFAGFGDSGLGGDSNWTSDPDPRVERGTPESFGEMDDVELTMAALFNGGMRPERRQEILGERVDAVSGLFGDMF